MSGIVERLRDALRTHALRETEYGLAVWMPEADVIEAAATITDLLAALRPFANVAEHDIGCDEDDTDRFRPMSGGLNIAPLPTVGHFRNALAAIAKAKAVQP